MDGAEPQGGGEGPRADRARDAAGPHQGLAERALSALPLRLAVGAMRGVGHTRAVVGGVA